MNHIVSIQLPHTQTERRFESKPEAKAFERTMTLVYGPAAIITVGERETMKTPKKSKRNAAQPTE